MPDPPPVRPATAADAPACRRLQSHLPRPSPRLLDYGLGVDLDAGDPDAGDPDAVGGAGEVLVSTADGAVVGYLLALSGPETHVAEVVVAPDRRREGRARALVEALFDRDSGRVTVATAPENAAALALYESLGFEREGVDETFYGDAPAVLLSRPPEDG